MRTAKEITRAIELARKEEEKRQQLIKWSIEIIAEAAEEMYKKLQLSAKLMVVSDEIQSFEEAWDQPEVVQCLETNGFSISRSVIEDKTYFILKVK